MAALFVLDPTDLRYASEFPEIFLFLWFNCYCYCCIKICY